MSEHISLFLMFKILVKQEFLCFLFIFQIYLHFITQISVLCFTLCSQSYLYFGVIGVSSTAVIENRQLLSSAFSSRFFDFLYTTMVYDTVNILYTVLKGCAEFCAQTVHKLTSAIDGAIERLCDSRSIEAIFIYIFKST